MRSHSECDRCGGEGYLQQCRADGSDCRNVACECAAGAAWEWEPMRDAEYERAAARARGNDFEATDGRDWT